MATMPTRAEIERTYALILPRIRVTPVLHTSGAGFGGPPVPLTLKLEQLQHAGSFKARGAFANLMLRKIPATGVVAASGGNHGVAVAYAASQLGIAARIFVPTVASPARASPCSRSTASPPMAAGCGVTTLHACASAAPR